MTPSDGAFLDTVDGAFVDTADGAWIRRASFVDVINSLAVGMAADPALKAFCESKWYKTLKVSKKFRKRIEIKALDLPIVLITRPTIEKSYRIDTRDGTHTVILYCGFKQNDRHKSLEELIGFEEAIDDYLLSAEPYTHGAINIQPGQSINSESSFHPNYFITMEVLIQHRR